MVQLMASFYMIQVCVQRWFSVGASLCNMMLYGSALIQLW